MKRLFLIRHAKSDWSDDTLNDFDRGLNVRGKKDAPFMGALYAKKGITPSLVLSSSARRAKATARKFVDAIDKEIHITYIDALYEAGVAAHLNVLREIDDSHESVFVFSHNPGLNELSYYLSGYKVENIPTCGVFEMSLNVSSWSQLDKESCNFVEFEYPKKYN